MRDKLYNRINEAILDWSNNQNLNNGEGNFITSLSKNIKTSVDILFRYKYKNKWVNVFKHDIDDLLWIPSSTGFGNFLWNNQEELFTNANNRPIVINFAKWSWSLDKKTESSISFICTDNIQEFEIKNLSNLINVFKEYGIIYPKDLNIWTNKNYISKIAINGNIPEGSFNIHLNDIRDFIYNKDNWNSNSQTSSSSDIIIDFSNLIDNEKGCLSTYCFTGNSNYPHANINIIPRSVTRETWSSAQEILIDNIKDLVIDTKNIPDGKLNCSLVIFNPVESLDDLFNIPGISGIADGHLNFYISSISDDLKQKYMACKSRKYPYFKNIFQKYILEYKLENYKSIEWMIKITNNLSVVYTYYNYYSKYDDPKQKLPGNLSVSTIK